MSETADWYRPVAAYLGYDDEGECNFNAHRTSIPPSPYNTVVSVAAERRCFSPSYCHCHYCRSDRVILPRALKEKTIEELAREFVEYIKKHSSDLGYGIRSHISEMFWEEKGLHRNSVSGVARYLLKAVELEVSKKLKAIQQEQENERMPTLVEECVKWCKEHGVTKVTLTIVGSFLCTKETRLSVNGKYILFLKASSMLAAQQQQREFTTREAKR